MIMDNKTINNVAQILQEIRNPQIIQEEEFTDEQVKEHAQDITNKIIAIWKGLFPTAGATARGSSLGGRGKPQTTFITLTLGREKSEFVGGIIENDPLNLRISIDTHPKLEKIAIDYNRNSVSITPEDKYMAFGIHKFKLRKQMANNEKALLDKVKKDLTKVKTELLKLYKDGKMSVHDRENVLKDMLKKKLR